MAFTSFRQPRSCVIRYNRKLMARVLFSLMIFVGCGDSTGAGASGGTGGSGTGAAGSDAGGSGATSTVFASCDAIGVCAPDTETGEADPTRSCIECAVFGTSEVAPNAGSCGDEYADCFGSLGDCTDGITECCGFYDCVTACDSDTSGSIEDGPELDCFCTNELDPESGARVCSSAQMPGTCLVDYDAGLDAAILWEDCVFGIAAEGACQTSCADN